MNPSPPQTALPTPLASALVFFASGVVLVLEILGVRLLAPFVGSSLDTYTAIIGTVLAGISLGTYLGGRLADRYSPATLLGPVLIISGATALFIVPAVRVFGGSVQSPSPGTVILLSAVALLIPAAVLSAISPIVVKLQLSSLQQTGATVGRLSAIGTAGAIAGTFLTGFVLLVHFRTSSIIVAIAIGLLVSGIACVAVFGGARGARSRLFPAAALAALMGIPLTFETGQLCDQESPYYCMRLIDSTDGSGGKYLALDRLQHSYVDVDRPTSLDFWYIQAMAAVFDSAKPQQDLKMLTIGGGGFTLPRYVAATRTDSATTSLEIDKKLIEFNREKLALDSVRGLDIRTGDARATIKALPAEHYDVVIGDAFGNESVPWHLSTVEFARDVQRTMKVDGMLVMNVIDYGSRDLLRAELKTLRQVWPEVALVERRVGGRVVDGNFVVVASTKSIAGTQAEARLAALEEPAFLVTGPGLDSLIADGQILTDDYAPADQLLAGNLRKAY